MFPKGRLIRITPDQRDGPSRDLDRQSGSTSTQKKRFHSTKQQKSTIRIRSGSFSLAPSHLRPRPKPLRRRQTTPQVHAAPRTVVPENPRQATTPKSHPIAPPSIGTTLRRQPTRRGPRTKEDPKPTKRPFKGGTPRHPAPLARSADLYGKTCASIAYKSTFIVVKKSTIYVANKSRRHIFSDPCHDIFPQSQETTEMQQNITTNLAALHHLFRDNKICGFYWQECPDTSSTKLIYNAYSGGHMAGRDVITFSQNNIGGLSSPNILKLTFRKL